MTGTQSLRSLRATSVDVSFHRSLTDLSIRSVELVSKGKMNQALPGQIISSADFRRIGVVQQGNSRSELDYEIFPIEDPEFYVPNRIVIPQPNAKHEEFLYSESIATTVVQGDVWVATGKSGVIKGNIMKNPYFIKMAGSESYQKMWPVQLERNIVPGDCGAWVVDAISGALYGHIVAGNSSLHRAYIIPAVDIIEDIRARFKHDPIMPKISRTRSASPLAVQPIGPNGTSHLPLSRNCLYTPASAELRSRDPYQPKGDLPLSYLHNGHINIESVGEQYKQPSFDLEAPLSETKYQSFINSIKKTPLKFFRKSNPAPREPDDRIIRENIDCRPHGYPRLASLINSDNDFAMFRRFGTLYARNLLYLQAEIVELEKQFAELDFADQESAEDRWRLFIYPQRRRDRLIGENLERAALCEKIRGKLKEYSSLLLQDTELRKLHKPSRGLYRGLFNYIWSNKPVATEDEQFIFHFDDFVCLADQSRQSWFKEAIVSFTLNHHISAFRSLNLKPEDFMKSQDPNLVYYSKRRLDKFLNYVAAFGTAATFLFAPSFILVQFQISQLLRVTIVMGFVLLFSVGMAVFTDSKTADIVLQTSAYSAVLLVLVGLLQSAN